MTLNNKVHSKQTHSFIIKTRIFLLFRFLRNEILSHCVVTVKFKKL